MASSTPTLGMAQTLGLAHRPWCASQPRSEPLPLVALAVEAVRHNLSHSVAAGRELSTGSLDDSFVTCALGRCRVGVAFPWQTVTGSN
jgi:hypothetical protein